ARAFKDGPGVFGRVAVDERLAGLQRGPRPRGGQRPVDALAAPFGPCCPAPDPGEMALADRFEPSRADDPSLALGDPQLHAVIESQTTQQSIGHFIRMRIT